MHPRMSDQTQTRYGVIVIGNASTHYQMHCLSSSQCSASNRYSGLFAVKKKASHQSPEYAHVMLCAPMYIQLIKAMGSHYQVFFALIISARGGMRGYMSILPPSSAMINQELVDIIIHPQSLLLLCLCTGSQAFVHGVCRIAVEAMACHSVNAEQIVCIHFSLRA